MTMSDDDTPVTRGEMRQIARKLRSRVFVDWTNETAASQLAVNATCEGMAEDIESVIGEGEPPAEDEL